MRRRVRETGKRTSLSLRRLAQTSTDRRQPSSAGGCDRALALLACEEQEDHARLRWAVGGAVLFHTLLLLLQFPELPTTTRAMAEERPVYVMEAPRFELPERDPAPRLPTVKSRIVPVPDPTPDDPEPIRPLDRQVALEIPDSDAVVVGIPEAPPSLGPEGPIAVRGDVVKPTKVFAPPPRYTEVARRVGIEGVVVLQAIIDTDGSVTDIEVLRGLPFGLTEAAVEAVRQWRFRPATLNGRPVAVYFNLSVKFEIRGAGH